MIEPIYNLTMSLNFEVIRMRRFRGTLYSLIAATIIQRALRSGTRRAKVVFHRNKNSFCDDSGPVGYFLWKDLGSCRANVPI